MKSRIPLLTLLLATLAAATLPAVPGHPTSRSVASDSARAEFEAGRFWHAARMLRAEGAAGSGPADVLLLARAEAGWNNWPSVAELLRDADWLEAEASGLGLYLLGRGEEDEGRWAAAAAAFDRYLDSAPEGSVRRQASLVRAARVWWKAGDHDQALARMDRAGAPTDAMSWLALDLAEAAAEDGDVEAAQALLLRLTSEGPTAAAWRLLADAQTESGDSAAATETFGALRESQVGARRSIATVELGRLLLAAGDSARARDLLLEGVEDGPIASRARAAGPLLDMGGTDREFTLELARIMDRAGDGRRALRGYDRVVALSAEEGAQVPVSMRIERARLMGTVRARQTEALEEHRAIRDVVEDDALGVRNLQVWEQLRLRQGLTSQVTTLRRWLVEEYPSSPAAAEIMFSAATQAQSRGQLDSALAQYAVLSERARTHARAGEGRMRSGQIHLGRSDRSAAVAVYESYLDDFPDGRRWTEASYWAARTRWELGDTAAAREHVERIFRGDPVSYYAVVGADLLGMPYDLAVPEAEQGPRSEWLTAGLRRIDLYSESGLERAASAEIEELRSTARESKDDMLSLAEGLIERGRTIDGINLGWALREDGHEWDARLIRVAFPFPYRELVRREAAEWGIDPITMAAIIRQESAFKADIVSHAGAVGLMQVMPPTGAQLARAHGPEGFREANLTAPEVNLHLGAAFFVEMSGRFDNDLPLVLSAYNAGPTRATRWRRYPEVSDPLRFTERIPFVETRGYVKNVRRNLGLYRALYGPMIVGDQE